MKLRLPFIYNENNFILGENNEEKTNVQEKKDEKLSGYYISDINLLKREFGYKTSGDVKLREFSVRINSSDIDAALFYIDGLVNKSVINNFILMPMMVHSREMKLDNINDVFSVLLPQSEAVEEDKIAELSYALNFGSAILLVNGFYGAIAIDVKGWNSKPIGEPQSEKVIRGPNDAFNEQIRSNTALIRRLIRSSNLISCEKKIGTISQTPCSVMYMKNIADDKLVNEVIRRIDNISIDYIMTSAELELYLEEKTFSSIPQFLSTERPDRTAKAILDGKVAIIVDGSPYALLMPATFYELNESTEDAYLRYPYSNMMRLVRAVAFLYCRYEFPQRAFTHKSAHCYYCSKAGGAVSGLHRARIYGNSTGDYTGGRGKGADAIWLNTQHRRRTHSRPGSGGGRYSKPCCNYCCFSCSNRLICHTELLPGAFFQSNEICIHFFRWLRRTSGHKCGIVYSSAPLG